MPQPTASDVHVNRPLTNISVAYIQSADSFIARRAFPRVSVQFKSDLYYRYKRDSFFRDGMRKRAPGTESAGGGYEIDTATYSCDVWALHKNIDDQTRANTDAPLNNDRDATRWLTQQRLIRMEAEFANTALATSVWDTDVTGVSGTPSGAQVKQWNDAASTPIDDIKDYKTAVLQATGMMPNVLVLGHQVWDKLSVHPDLLDRVKYSGGVSNGSPAMVSKQAAAALFELDEILVSSAVENTATEGQSFSGSFIAGKKGLLMFRPSEPGLMVPAAGYTFEWDGLMGSQDGQRIKSFRVETLSSDRIEIETAFDQKVVASPMGVLFSSLVA